MRPQVVLATGSAAKVSALWYWTVTACQPVNVNAFAWRVKYTTVADMCLMLQPCSLEAWITGGLLLRGHKRGAERGAPCLGPCDCMATTVVNGCVCFLNAGGYRDGIAEWRHLIPGDGQRLAEAVSPLQARTICGQRGRWTGSGCSRIRKIKKRLASVRRLTYIFDECVGPVKLEASTRNDNHASWRTVQTWGSHTSLCTCCCQRHRRLPRH